MIQNDYLDVPGLIYVSNFLLEEEQKELLDTIYQQEWSNELSRRVQHYGYKYNYRNRSVTQNDYLGPLPDFLQKYASALYENFFVPEMPDQVIINEYLPGQGIAQHVDCPPCFEDYIASISLGSVYDMNIMKNIGYYPDSTSSVPRIIDKTVKLELGSCIIFSGESRYKWTHGISRIMKDRNGERGTRVSLTMRKVKLEQ